MRKFIKGLIFIIAVAVVSVLSSATYFYFHFDHRRHITEITHDWLHNRLQLTAEQKATLSENETEAVRREEILRNQIKHAKFHLATLLEAERAYTPNIEKTITLINTTHGELQKTIMEHFFTMHAVLDEERQQELIEMATRALREP